MALKHITDLLLRTRADNSTQIIVLSTETHIQRLVTDVYFWMRAVGVVFYTFILLFFLSLVLSNEHCRITLAAETVAAVVCVFVRVPVNKTQ